MPLARITEPIATITAMTRKVSIVFGSVAVANACVVFVEFDNVGNNPFSPYHIRSQAIIPIAKIIAPIMILLVPITQFTSHFILNRSNVLWLGSKHLTVDKQNTPRLLQISEYAITVMAWVTCEHCKFEYQIAFTVNGSTDSIMSKCPRCSKRNGEQFLREQFKKYTGKEPDYVDMGT